MPSSTPTRLQKFVLSASVIANAVLGGYALYVNGPANVTGDSVVGGALQVAGTMTGTTAKFTGTMTGAKIEVRPATASGVLRIRSGVGPTATGGALCLERRNGIMDICFSSGGRVDCDPDTRGLCAL